MSNRKVEKTFTEEVTITVCEICDNEIEEFNYVSINRVDASTQQFYTFHRQCALDKLLS